MHTQSYPLCRGKTKYQHPGCESLHQGTRGNQACLHFSLDLFTIKGRRWSSSALSSGPVPTARRSLVEAGAPRGDFGQGDGAGPALQGAFPRRGFFPTRCPAPTSSLLPRAPGPPPTRGSPRRGGGSPGMLGGGARHVMGRWPPLPAPPAPAAPQQRQQRGLKCCLAPPRRERQGGCCCYLRKESQRCWLPAPGLGSRMCFSLGFLICKMGILFVALNCRSGGSQILSSLVPLIPKSNNF